MQFGQAEWRAGQWAGSEADCKELWIKQEKMNIFGGHSAGVLVKSKRGGNHYNLPLNSFVIYSFIWFYKVYIEG